mmetsp:Transcript_27615/g.75941  ORF Transcript_27615/g.75941 Transcript_27615/m.75941 type:complete len:492 (-) Transcript_27615:456-1931(-)
MLRNGETDLALVERLPLRVLRADLDAIEKHCYDHGPAPLVHNGHELTKSLVLELRRELEAEDGPLHAVHVLLDPLRRVHLAARRGQAAGGLPPDGHVWRGGAALAARALHGGLLLARIDCLENGSDHGKKAVATHVLRQHVGLELPHCEAALHHDARLHGQVFGLWEQQHQAKAHVGVELLEGQGREDVELVVPFWRVGVDVRNDESQCAAAQTGTFEVLLPGGVADDEGDVLPGLDAKVLLLQVLLESVRAHLVIGGGLLPVAGAEENDVRPFFHVGGVQDLTQEANDYGGELLCVPMDLQEDHHMGMSLPWIVSARALTVLHPGLPKAELDPEDVANRYYQEHGPHGAGDHRARVEAPVAQRRYGDDDPVHHLHEGEPVSRRRFDEAVRQQGGVAKDLARKDQASHGHDQAVNPERGEDDHLRHDAGVLEVPCGQDLLIVEENGIGAEKVERQPIRAGWWLKEAADDRGHNGHHVDEATYVPEGPQREL